MAMKETTNEELSKQLKRNIERDQKTFMKLLEESSPQLDYTEIYDVFNERSSKNSKKLIDLATQALSFVNAVYYANRALSESLGASDSSFNIKDINDSLTKILRLKITRLLCREFNIPRDLEKKVIYNVIEKEFTRPIRQGTLINAQPQAVGSNHQRRESGFPKTKEKGSATRYGDR